MKSIITTLLAFYTLIVVGQTSQVHLENGITKHNQQDYKGAIIDYTKAIKEDKTNAVAYFNRGSCELALKDYKSAMNDFNKTIELDPRFAKAYYSRASVHVSQGNYIEALPDLDYTIDIDQSIPNALTLRGQIRAQSGNLKGACKDFNLAKEIGDQQADKYLSKFCGEESKIKESFMLDWPDSENWKVGSNQENAQMNMVELIHVDETLENWTEIGSMISIKGVKNIPMDQAMNMMFDQSKVNAPKAKLTFIEKDESTEFPWIIFTIESPSFKNDNTPESQLWFIIQGKSSLYTNFRAIKKPTIPAELINNWIKFFKTGKIVRE